MRYRATLAAALASAALLFVAGCGDETASGTPTAAPSTGPSSSASDFGAPEVETPLDTSSIDSTPCDVATAEQIEQLPGTNSEKKTEDTATKSKSCAWFFEDEDQFSLGSVRAGTILEPGANGLQTYYKADSNGNLGHFEELPPVMGYPAVAYEQAAKNPGDCTMAVGVRNDMAYSVSIGLRKDHPNYDDPCTVGRKIAEFAIEYLQGKQ